MTQNTAQYDVCAVGNAIVDVLSPCDAAFLTAQDLAPNSMQLVDADRSAALYDAMAPGVEASGGSAGNTVAGVGSFGGRAAYIGKVADDTLGQVFTHDIRAAGVHFDTPVLTGGADQGFGTGRCLINVLSDGQRTMSTFLGAANQLTPDDIDPSLVAASEILYLEGYLWDPEEPRRAMRRAIEVAREAGRKVAFTASESFVIDRHGDDFRALIEEGQIDILFANKAELAALTGEADFDAGIAALAPSVPVLVVTRSEHGAVAVSGGERAEVAAEPVAAVVDTTGAGDLFAAGFLAGHVRGESLQQSLAMGAVAAGEIISHYGARPEANLRELMSKRFG